MDATNNRQELLSLATEIVGAFVGNNVVATADVPALISNVFAALRSAGVGQVEQAVEAPVPAVPIKRSVRPDFIICLEDGKKLKTLKRHLASPLEPDAGAVSPALGSGQGLPDGGAGLRGTAFGVGQGDSNSAPGSRGPGEADPRGERAQEESRLSLLRFNQGNQPRQG